MNKPNILTISRIILFLPFFILMILTSYFGVKTYKNINIGLYLLIIAGIIFIIAMITDWLDGYLARKNNQITSFGKLFDPIADKFLTTTSLIMLSIIGFIPIWITTILILRDILVDGSRNIAAKNNLQISASFWGKAKTLILSLAIPIIIFIAPIFYSSIKNVDVLFKNVEWKLWILNIPIFLATIFSIIGGVNYLKIIIPYIQTK